MLNLLLEHPFENNRFVKIVEGEFDSMFLKNCIASGDSSLVITADSIQSDNKVLIFDNEPRNKEIVKLMGDAIKLNYHVVIWPDTIEEKEETIKATTDQLKSLSNKELTPTEKHEKEEIEE